jgi:ATPase subunit of ABC transporter with duplicated ATPase domains
MVTVTNLAKSWGGQTLFSGVSLQLQAGKRYGLVGGNGSGKTTFLRILAGEEPPSEGSINLPRKVRVGFLRQDQFLEDHRRILEVAMLGRREVWEAMQERDRLLAHAEHETFDGNRYAELEDFILRNDGYALEARAGEILEGLGIPTALHHQPLAVLSGGFKLRALLAQTLTAEPDLLLLDEPTNHLDIVTIRWLEKFLLNFPGCAVVISHDHRFLDNIATHILDVDYGVITLYPGNYSDFEAAKIAERERREAEIAKREAEIAHHKEFIERFRAKATKARQAKSKQKLIERIEIEPLPPSSRRYPRFRFRSRRHSGRQVLALRNITKRFGNQLVLHQIQLELQRGDRLAILGPNGIGKSTLLKIAVGKLAPDAGQVEWGYETRVGYFAQDHRELLESSDQTLLSWFWSLVPGEPVGFVRGKLAEVLFEKEEVEKPLRALSGGEAARAIFARLSVEEPNVLVLDEPTNHLDLEAIESLVAGLREYDGTLLFVSHDRWFVEQLATRIFEITPAGVQDFPGTYREYLDRCGDDHLDAEAVLSRLREEKREERRKEAAARKTPTPQENRKRRQLEKRRDELTEAIDRAERRIHEINELFANPGFFQRTAPGEVKQLESEQTRLRDEVHRWMAEWEAVEEELERFSAVNSPTA